MTISLARRPTKLAIAAGAFLLGTAATYLALVMLVLLARLLDAGSSDVQVVTIEVTRFLISITGGLVLARVLTARRGSYGSGDASAEKIVATSSRASRLAMALFTLGYLATWAFGVPSVQSALENDALQTWKKLEARDHRPEWQGYPFIRTYCALPPLPFLILTYHEYQVAGMHGWGGWQLHFWVPGHIKRLGSKMAWIS